MDANSFALDLQRALHLVAEGIRSAGNSERLVLISLVQPITAGVDPAQIFARAGRFSQARSFFSRPVEDRWIVNAGETSAISVSGARRFHDAVLAHRAMVRSAFAGAGSSGGPGPLFFACFGFSSEVSQDGPWKEIPNGLLILPRWTFVKKQGSCWARVNLLVSRKTCVDEAQDQLRKEADELISPAEPFCNPPVTLAKDELSCERWRRSVGEVLAEIQRGKVAKVTLARTLRLRAAAAIGPEPVLERLLAAYPSCIVFAVARPGMCFLGATPEDLVSLEQGRARSTCMAGSAWRVTANGIEPGAERSLVWGEKELREHAVTADWVGERMGRFCHELDRDSAPQAVRLGQLYHLATRFNGVAQSGTHVLDLVAALHPTPAVGGTPLEPALEMIRRLERHDRGWYGGPVGWLDGQGGGQFGVAIRSALLRGDEALLYAGAGLVEGSDAEMEYEETEMKFVPLLSALGVA
ncbi:MAG: isochorismate synthase [Deltaproteobacteria bacterium]|nr:isochorismate synthase [Deltaproteobacteria bacterium]